jgi:Fic family protein
LGKLSRHVGLLGKRKKELLVVEDDARTTIRVEGGGLEIRNTSQSTGFDFTGVSIKPARPEPRYSVSLRTLGQLERLAKARFLLAERVPDFDPTKVEKTDEETARSIALSVFASSEIEGEGVAAEHVEAFVAALTEPGEHLNKELDERLLAHQDIIDTYFWALNSSSEPILSYEFVLEAHKKMFHRSKGSIAGQIKDREVSIRWRQPDGTLVNVPTVSADRAEEFLRSLCERTSNMFSLAMDSADAPMLLAAAEFACDFLAIHPFIDGNGRTARLLSTYLIERGGYHFSRVYPLDQVVLDSRKEYYKALNISQRHWHTSKEDLTPWTEYFVNAVFEQWERSFRRIRNQAVRPL